MSRADEIREFGTKEELSDSLAEHVLRIANAAIAERNRFTVALSGGSLPAQLGSARLLNGATEWDKWHVLYSDERFVALDDAESNHAAVSAHLLSKVPIVGAHVHTLQFDAAHGSVEAAAQRYEADLQQLFGSHSGGDESDDGVIEIDLILLGMGPDGHTASLFPGHPLLAERERLIAPIADSPKPPPHRITFTYPLINAARNVAFVVTGDAKQSALQQIFDNADCQLPAALVKPAQPVVWFADAPALAFRHQNKK